jgi:hypothetical protein
MASTSLYSASNNSSITKLLYMQTNAIPLNLCTSSSYDCRKVTSTDFESNIASMQRHDQVYIAEHLLPLFGYEVIYEIDLSLLSASHEPFRLASCISFTTIYLFIPLVHLLIPYSCTQLPLHRKQWIDIIKDRNQL